MKNNDELDGIKAYNFNFIKNYPDKIELEIKEIESKAMNLLAIDGVFITLIITLLFSSLPQILEKLPGWSLPIFNGLIILYLLHFIIVGLSSIMCFRIKKYDYFDEYLLKDKVVSKEIKDISNSTKDEVEFEIALNLIKKNKIQLAKKQGCVDRGLYSFLSGMVILSVILVLCVFILFINV